MKVTCDLPRKETLASPPPGGGTPYAYDGLYGEAPPERVTFFSLQVYEMLAISLAEVYECVGELIMSLRR